MRSHIGVVPQKAVLFKGTVAENLRWGDENASEQTLEEMCIRDRLTIPECDF